MPMTEVMSARVDPPPRETAFQPLVSAGPKPRKSMRGRWLAAAFVLLAAALGTWLYVRHANEITWQTVAADRGDIVSAVTTTGNCNAVKSVQVGSQISGNILDLYADFNTQVKQGQLVAQIDPAMFQARVDQASANLASAKAGVVTAQANIKKADSDIANARANVANMQANVVKAQSAVDDARTKNERRVLMVKEGIIAQEDADTAQSTYDQAVAALDAAKAAVTAAEAGVAAAMAAKDVAQTQLEAATALVNQDEANLRQAQLDLEHTRITAPVDGTVVSRNMDVGQTVAASFQAPTIFLIAQDLTQMQVDTNVDESDVAPIRERQTATFTVDAYPGQIFIGKVAQIRDAPINVQNVITYDVVINVSNKDLKLFPGMTANVRIITDTVQNALRIPVAALRYRPATSTTSTSKTTKTQARQAMQTVYVMENGEVKPVHVKLGIGDGNFVQVLSGLSEGQRVVVASTSKNTPAPAAAQQMPGGGRRLGM